jgi:hypothetical protein
VRRAGPSSGGFLSSVCVYARARACVRACVRARAPLSAIR